ncbi:hypothetical protein [Inquilinus limosus]|uniref:hypothetical protein n=1 Tax=Inquilinus limosus TaxID=171674 RepID=UPI0012DF21D5
MDRGSEPISCQKRFPKLDKTKILHFPRRDLTRHPAGDPDDHLSQVDRCMSGGHREAPLIVYHPDGAPKSEWWFSVDGAHRTDRPAYVRHNRDGSRVEHWYLHHRRHRTDGPAVIEWMKDGSVRCSKWWVAGREVTDIAESFLAESEASWPFDEVDERIFLRRCVYELRARDPGAETMRREPILVGMGLASLFWLPVIVTVALLWA